MDENFEAFEPEESGEAPAEADARDENDALSPEVSDPSSEDGGASEAEEGAEGDKAEKAISSDLIRGHINTIILRSLYDGDKYGYEIIAEIEAKSHGQYSLKQPTLYSALKRLEKDGYITSYWGGSVGGGRRKYFSLTDEGKTVSEQNQSEWEYSRTIIDSLISDRDFDFSNPAPSNVNMRVLRDTTSRVPNREDGEGDEVDFETAFGEAERTRLEEDYAKKSAELDEAKAALEQERARFEEEMHNREQELQAEREQQAELLKNEREAHEAAITEREQLVEEEYKRHEEERAAEREELATARAERETAIADKERSLAEERQRYDFLLAEKEARLAEEEQRHRRELAEQEKRIREEQEAIFRQREQQIIHQNYINLVNAPPEAPQGQNEYSYYNAAPAAYEEPPAASPPASYEEDYRTVVRRLYNSAQTEAAVSEETPDEPRVQSLDGIDFRDLEARAVQDGIRITTTGGKHLKKQNESENIVHKGKALFLSAVVVFFYCVALGSVALGVQKTLALPLFYPYFIWAVGVCLLLVTGLAYANHYGERALRRSRLVLVNTAVIYALLVIVTLIVALAVNGDFSSLSYLATFIIFPVVFFLAVVVFGVVYYLQVRPFKKK